MTQTAQTSPEARQASIPVDLIDPDPTQPRKLFDEAKLAELARSMADLGQLQPVTVRPAPDGRYTLIMGERRWRAAQRANLPDLHALVLDIDDPREVFIRAVAENVGRADMTPMEEAQAYQRLREQGYELAEIASRVGRSAEHVKWRMDLMQLVPAMREATDRGHVPVGCAWYVCQLAPDMQNRFLTKWARGEFATVRDAEAFAQACRVVAEQDSLLLIDEPSVEMRAQIVAQRKRVVNKIERLSAAGEILSELAQMSPADLARVLGGAQGGVTAYRVRIDHLKDMAVKAAGKLRHAAALNAAATLDLNPEILDV